MDTDKATARSAPDGRTAPSSTTPSGTTTQATGDPSLWSYRNDVLDGGAGLAGFDVEASDGHIGKVDEDSASAGRSTIVVDTGFWIFGKKRRIPAGLVERINRNERKVFIRMTKDDVKHAPEHTDGDIEPDVYEEYYRPFRW